MGPCVGLRERLLRSRARAVNQHSNGHRHEHQRASNDRKDHRQRRHWGTPCRAVSATAMLRLVLACCITTLPVTSKNGLSYHEPVNRRAWLRDPTLLATSRSPARHCSLVLARVTRVCRAVPRAGPTSRRCRAAVVGGHAPTQAATADAEASHRPVATIAAGHPAVDRLTGAAAFRASRSSSWLGQDERSRGEGIAGADGRGVVVRRQRDSHERPAATEQRNRPDGPIPAATRP
jgi:hypothetical protein